MKRHVQLVPNHCGELIQGPIEWDGRIVVGLVTLPMDTFNAVSVFSGHRERTSKVAVTPTRKKRTLKAVEAFARAFSLDMSGQLSVMNNASDLEGRGYGTSSAEILSALKVFAVANGLNVPEEVLQSFAWSAEKATDPLLLGPVLYASREGRVLRRYPSIPYFRCIAFDFEEVLDTAVLATGQASGGFSLDHIAEFKVVLAMFERGIATHDRRLVARAATQSAKSNLEQEEIHGFPPEKRQSWDALAKMIDHEVLLGISTSHSGTATALLIDPDAHNEKVATLIDKVAAELGIDRYEMTEFYAVWSNNQ